MSSDQAVPGFIEDPDTIGRTWADLLYSSRRHLLVFILILSACIVAYIFRDSFGGIVDAVADYSDAICFFVVCFVLFFIIGRSVTRTLLRVPTVDYLVLDFDSMRGSLYRIPVPMLSLMEVSGGNDLTFAWRTGDTFRLARNVDLENGIIETAWPHEVPIEQAAFTLSDLQRREEDYERAKIENLYLRRRSIVIAADLARRANADLAHEISDVLSLDELDIDAYLDGLDPLKHRMTDSEGGGDDAGEQAAE